MTIEPYLRFSELLPEATLLLSEDGGILSANRAAADQLGLDPKTLPGRRLTDVATDPPDTIAQFLRACSQASDLVLGTLTLAMGDGQVIACRAEGAVLLPRSEGVNPLLLLRLIPHKVAVPPPLAPESQPDELSRESAARKRAEAALRESEERLRLALAAGRMGTWDWEVRTGRVTWSQSLETLHGLAPGTFDGTFKTSIDMIHPEDRELVTRSAAQSLDGTRHDTQYRIVRPDGSVRWLEGRGRPFYDESGEPARMLGISMDITELKQTEEALRESEAKYRRIIETAAEGIWIVDGAVQTVYVNHQLADMAGFPVEELLGRSGFDFVHSENHDEAKRRMEEIRQGIRNTFDFHLRRKDGSGIWTRASVNPIFDDAGEFLGALGMVTDITERKRAEEALRRERDFAESMIETAQAIVLVLDTERQIVRFNPFMEAISGYRLEEVQGLDWFSTFLPERDWRRGDHLFTHILAGGKTNGTVNSIVTKDGCERMIEWSSKALKDGCGGIGGVLSIGHDITDLREAQQRVLQAERLAAIGEMVAGLAHESRNALHRGQVCLEMLAMEVEDRPEALRLIARLQKAQDDLSGLYEDVRDYAAPVKLDRKSCHMADIWRAAWMYLDPVQKGREARLLEEIGGLDLDCVVDPSRLEQVFRNIMENALAACRDPVAVGIGCAPADLGGHPALRVTMRDNGPGLNPEQRRRIFEPFFTTKSKGTGLGMAIARRIIDAHGGRIAVGGGEGPGAEIIMTLPRGRP